MNLKTNTNKSQEETTSKINKHTEHQVFVEFMYKLSTDGYTSKIFNKLANLYFNRLFVWVSQSTLARWLGCTREWVNKCIRYLREMGIIESTRRNWISNLYGLPSWMNNPEIMKLLGAWFPAFREAYAKQFTVLNLSLSHNHVYEQILSPSSMQTPETPKNSDEKVDMSAYPEKQPQSAQKYPEKKPLCTDNPFSDLAPIENSSIIKSSPSNTTPEESKLQSQSQVHEEKMQIRNLKRGREPINTTIMDITSGVLGATPTKRWYEEDTNLSQQEKEVCVNKLLEAYDSPGTIWLRRFIGEEDTHKLMSRVIENTLSD